MLARMQAHARQLGVVVELGARVDQLPDPPVIVATSLEAARRLLGDDTLRWDSGRTVLLDLGLDGDRSPAHLGERLDAIQRVMPQAERVVMRKRDHGADLKHPTEVARVIEDLADKVLRPLQV